MYTSQSLIRDWLDETSQLRRADQGAYTDTLAGTPCDTAKIGNPYFDFICEPDSQIVDFQDRIGLDQPSHVARTTKRIVLFRLGPADCAAPTLVKSVSVADASRLRAFFERSFVTIRQHTMKDLLRAWIKVVR